MSNTELIQKIDNAKDEFGVITPTALHDQLGTLTDADWREAAAVFSKTSTVADGFYIEDNNGNVTIHNDLKQAHETADNSVVSATLNDAKVVAGLGATLVGVSAAAAGSGALLPATGLESLGVGGAAAAAGSAALVAGEVVGVIGAAVIVGDLGRNYWRKSDAQEDIRTAAQVTLNQRSA